MKRIALNSTVTKQLTVNKLIDGILEYCCFGCKCNRIEINNNNNNDKQKQKKVKKAKQTKNAIKMADLRPTTVDFNSAEKLLIFNFNKFDNN